MAVGHLGELTPLVPCALVDEVLAATAGRQPGRLPAGDGRVRLPRVRVLPARVAVYFTLAMVLFPEVGYAGVWAKLTWRVASPGSGAISRARARVGSAPLAALFGRLAGGSRCGAVWFGLRLVAVDGTCLSVPDSAGNLAHLGKRGVRNGDTGFPLVRVTALVECGTRALIDVVFGTMSIGETAWALHVFASLRPGMLLLADRGFDTNTVIAAVVTSPAELLLRIKTLRSPVPVARPLPDGSQLAVMAGQVLRIVTAQVTLTSADGTRRTQTWRLATTVTDWRTAPATELVQCYHRRWEVETAFLGLKATILHGRVLRSQTPDLLDQEIWALMCIYQVLTTAISLALAHTGIDRSAGSFHEAVQAARDQIIRAEGLTAAAAKRLTVIGQRIRDRPVSRRGPRTGPRSVKRPISKYAYKDLGVAKTTHQAVIHITINQPPADGIP